MWGVGGLGKSSPFFLPMFFDQFFSCRVNGIQIFSLWSCVLGFCLKCFLFKIGTHFLWMFFILYNLLSCKLHLQTLGLHIIVIRQCQEGNSTFQRDGFFLFCWKPIWGWFFLNIKFLQELHFVHKCFLGPHRPPVYWLQVEHVSFPPLPWLCVYGWPVVYGKVAGWSGWKTHKLFL